MGSEYMEMLLTMSLPFQALCLRVWLKHNVSAAILHNTSPCMYICDTMHLWDPQPWRARMSDSVHYKLTYTYSVAMWLRDIPDQHLKATDITAM